ncbi:MAG: hypothetical protein PHT31_01525 [Candidatus Omnitrophica bacterium]|nr:hypothetical protein [Candidatus Omnitrophota bacterium]MDD5652828.1 hypothetical protein [Candidatus Omnitrophota bacterium]
MKNYKLLKNMLVILTVLFFGAGISWAQGSASPSTPQEKQEQERAKMSQKATETAPLELSEPVVVSPGEEEKAEEAAKPEETAEAPAEVKEGEAVQQAVPAATEEGQKAAETKAEPTAKSGK